MSQSLRPAPSKQVALGNRVVNDLVLDQRIADVGATRLIRVAVLVIALAMAAFLVWANWAKLNETTIASGTIVPTGNVVLVQHFEGGILAETLVREGDLVEAGDPLVRLNAIQASGDLEQYRSRRIALLLQEERLRALADDRVPDFSDVDARYGNLVANQLAILNSSIVTNHSQIQVFEAKIHEQEAQLATNQQEQAYAVRVVKLLEEELEIRQGLTDRGLSPRLQLLSTKREYNEAQTDLDRLRNDSTRIEKTIQQTRNQINEIVDRTRSEALAEAGLVAAQRAELEEQIESLEDRVNRSIITAPARGRIQQLVARSPGTVISPGGTIAEIVPVDRELLVEAKISPRDIGFVSVGQEVKVKVDTYDFSRFGAVPGELVYISPSTLLDEEQQPYYEGRVRLSTPYVGTEPGKNPLLPGMTVQADITTGDKTVIAYLLKPIYTNLDRAMTER